MYTKYPHNAYHMLTYPQIGLQKLDLASPRAGCYFAMFGHAYMLCACAGAMRMLFAVHAVGGAVLVRPLVVAGVGVLWCAYLLCGTVGGIAG